MLSFGVRKFYSLLVAGTLTVLATFFGRILDSIIAGNMLGADALSAIALVSAVGATVTFFAGVVATGMATHYSRNLGRCKLRRAHEYFIQALWTILIVGSLISLLVFFGRDFFVGFMAASPVVSEYAVAYLSWSSWAVIPECLMVLLAMLCYADGDAHLCFIAYVVNAVLKICVSILAIDLGMGVGGCAFATIVSYLVGIGILSIHFFRKNNSLRFVKHFSLRDSVWTITAAFGDQAVFLCDGILFFFLSKLVIHSFGSDLLPVVGAVTAVWGLLEFFDGMGIALQPIISVYYGEGNTKSVRTVMNAAFIVCLAESFLFLIIFGLFPALTCSVLGIDDPAHIAHVTSAVRSISIGFFATAITYLFNSYYMFIDRPMLGTALTFTCSLFMPVACLAFGSVYSINGLWFGLGIGPLLGLLMIFLCIAAVVGMRRCPYLLSRSHERKIHVFNLHLTPGEIVETSRKIGELPGVPMRASLMTEEVFMAIRDRNGSKKVIGEATVNMNKSVQLTLRDDGEIFDITDCDQRVSSLRTFLVASVMEQQAVRMNFVTTGFNRNVFKF